MEITSHQMRSLAQFDTANGEIMIGTQTVSEYFADQDLPPTFLYAKKSIAQRVADLRRLLPREIALHYAIKANPFEPVVAMLCALVDGLDVASAGELAMARNIAGPEMSIGFAGPGKTDSELRAAILDGCTLQVESKGEFDRIESLANELNQTAQVALRLNPDFELRSSGMKMTGAATPFGMEPDTAAELLLRTDSAQIRFRGLHIYTGSQCLDAAAICESQSASLALATALLADRSDQAFTVNIGGGFGIPYFRQDEPLDVGAVANNLSEIVRRFSQHFPAAVLALELGRYLVGESGVYLSRVVDKKRIRGKTFIICNGGLHHHLPASGNFGQVIRRDYPVLLANRLDEAPTEKVSIVGPLCTPLDILANEAYLPPANVGDIVAVFQSGAYGLTASPGRFLSHAAAAEILI